MRSLRGWQIAFGLLAAVGCHRATLPAPPGPGAIGAAQVLALLARQEQETRTLTATFKLVVRRREDGEESTRGAVVVARPDRLRLQIFSFGMLTAYDYTVAGDRYRVRRPLEGVDKIGRFGGSPSADDALLGDDLRPLFLRSFDAAAAKVTDAGDHWWVTIAGADGVRKIEVAKAQARIDRESLTMGGETNLAIDYGDYRSVDGFPMPFSIRVAMPPKGVSLAIEITRYTRNQPVEPRLFEF